MQLLPPTFQSWSGASPERGIAVLMSGGVDSSVTALVLHEAGWQVVGVTMKLPALPGPREHPAPCCGSEAASVCLAIGIPHYFVDVCDAFTEQVIAPFRRSYLEGKTPNPCVDCNTRIKFSGVWDLIEQELGTRFLASGHYARVVHSEGRAHLARGSDPARDQSYFIYGVPRHRLSSFVLPMGDMAKADVRDLAERRQLPVANKPDSMELCFAGEGDYRQALSGEVDRPGPIRTPQGTVLGEHRGISNYTVGQRRGIGIAATEPLYVLRIEASENAIVVGTRGQAMHRVVQSRPASILVPELLLPGATLRAKVRSYTAPAPCRVLEATSDALVVEFEHPQFAATPGQHLVLYDELERVVAGGVIEQATAARAVG